MNNNNNQEIATPLSKVKNIIAVASGKGGVGKSTVSVNLAVALAKAGHKVGLVDADIYGPSIPMMFGCENEQPLMIEKNGKQLIQPIEKYGVKLLSIGFFVKPDQALIWRGPMASNSLSQLFTEADWPELDFMVLDLPPGTGDIPLTLVQTLPITGALIVTTPQNVAISDVRKSASMFKQTDIKVPILGIIENMSWFTPEELPENKYYIFGKDGGRKFAKELKINLLAQLPLVMGMSESGDKGNPIATNSDSILGKAFNELAKQVVDQVELRNSLLAPTSTVKIDPNAEGCKH